MSQFTSGITHRGATRPLQDGGVNFYINQTKPRGFANANVQGTYALFSTYNTPPPYLGERSGHYSVVVQQPDDKRMGAPRPDEIFERGNPQNDEITEYFLNKVPAGKRAVKNALTIKKYGLNELMERFLRDKLQQDVDAVASRYAGATEVERRLAFERLQNRYSDMVRHYGSDMRLREAIMRDVIGDHPDPAVREAMRNELMKEQTGLGTAPMSVAPGEVETFEGGNADMVNADATEQMESQALEKVNEMDQDEPEDYEGDDAVVDTAGEGSLNDIQTLRGMLLRVTQAIASLKNQRETAIANEDFAEADKIERMIRRAEDDQVNILMRIEALKTGTEVEGGLEAIGEGETDPGYAPGGTDSLMTLPSAGFSGRNPREGERGIRGSHGSSRPLVGHIIGHQAPSVPASSMATNDPAAAGTSARQDQMRRRGRIQRAVPGQRNVPEMFDQIFGVSQDATPMPQSVEHEVGTDRRRPRGRGRGRGRGRE